MTTAEKEHLIQSYINAYNSFDVDGMLKDLNDKVQFKNIAGNEVNMVLDGRTAFEAQAKQAMQLFQSRQQTVTTFQHEGDQTTCSISYNGILAVDLPAGLQKGTDLQLNGKSIFTFSHNKITVITDIG
ncbi:nuclear transport factor 2 family protein [Mucilaginibacter robiniae]|uniref:Nuclear transport factor 2 family protein n=1 Tax=Mucilaginibacter robiniae TaxID=2728022 RepID=A0A7L5E5W9_9SPHI|nr:nuclear transport factor 2 family protein [Mucilaginibacter robiniae]QJD97164.1 nuclear transport factor 2 family protein [Mucilaginibacter robiniae]